jgi:hypothetical protein
MIYFIAYPQSDKSKLKVCSEEYEYELKDYSLASKERWFVDHSGDKYDDAKIIEAVKYCQELCKKHNKEYVPCGYVYSDETIEYINDYLD